MAVTSGNVRSFEADADLSAKQYYVVKQTGDNTVDLAAAGTDAVRGAIQNKPQAGEGAQLVLSGRTAKVICGGSVSRGDRLTSDSAGKAVATTTEDDISFGIAMAAGDASDIIEYLPKVDKIEPAT